QLRAREAVPRQHALDGNAEDLGGSPVELLAQRARPQPARIARVPVIELLVELLAGDGDLLGVDNYDEVTGVDVRRVLRLALAAQRVSDARGKPPEGLALGVHDVPTALDVAGFCVPGLHAARTCQAEAWH